MVTEHIALSVLPGNEAEYEKVLAEARYVIASVKVMPQRFHFALGRDTQLLPLLVEFDSVEDHLKGVRRLEAFALWRRLLGHLRAPGLTIEHCVAVDSLNN